jgi:hypothetical protein
LLAQSLDPPLLVEYISYISWKPVPTAEMTQREKANKTFLCGKFLLKKLFSVLESSEV